MMKSINQSSILLSLLLTNLWMLPAGCRCHARHHAPQSVPSMSASLEPTTRSAYDGPPATVRTVALKTHPAQYLATVEVTAPTGGWTLTLDKNELVNGVLKLYLTLERPGAGELVTQSLVPLQASLQTTERVERAEAHIFVAQRGVSYLAASYQLAATSQP
jgi:hypothetical protein